MKSAASKLNFKPQPQFLTSSPSQGWAWPSSAPACSNFLLIMIRFLWVRNGPNSYCSVCCLNLHLTISSYIFLENSFARRPFTCAKFFLSFHTKNNLLKQKMPTTNFLPCQKSYHSLHSCVRLFLSPAAAIFLSICFLLMLSCQVWFHICNSFF